MQQIPVGEIVKIMDRGAITLPAKYRKKLDLKKGEIVNVIPVEPDGLFIVPVDVVPKKRKADWGKDSVGEYMDKVRYNIFEKIRANEARKAWSSNTQYTLF